MNADEILLAVEKADDVYFEANGWVIALDGNAIEPSTPWIAQHYAAMEVDEVRAFASFREAVTSVLRENK